MSRSVVYRFTVLLVIGRLLVIYYCVKVIMELVYVEQHYVNVSSLQVYILVSYLKITVLMSSWSLLTL